MYYFIVNPKSSSGRGLRIWKTIEPVLRKENISYQVAFTNSGVHASELARKRSLSHSPSTIVAVGGDGTVNDVLNGLHNLSSVTFGYIPTGSGNDLARSLRLPTKPQAALHAILHPTKIESLSVGVLETGSLRRRFAVSSGIGFDASVCADNLHSAAKHFFNFFHLGKLSYAAVALKQLLRLSPSGLTVSLDGGQPKTYDGFFFAAAMNLPYEGGGFRFCPDAVGNDDFLNLCLLKKIHKLKALCILPTAFWGGHTRFREVEILSFQKATLTTDTLLNVHTDGEVPRKAQSVSWYLEKERLPFIIK